MSRTEIRRKIAGLAHLTFKKIQAGRPMNEGLETPMTPAERTLEYDTNVTLAYLRNYVYNHPDRDLEAVVEAVEDLLRNRAPAVIRTLMERVRFHAKSLDEVNALAYKFSERLRFYESGDEEPIPPNLREKILNRAAYVVKLQDRIKIVETMLKDSQNVIKLLDKQYEARTESLEAERDIWKGRAGKRIVLHNMPVTRYQPPGMTSLEDWSDPTPSEIAARVEQNRKEKP